MGDVADATDLGILLLALKTLWLYLRVLCKHIRHDVGQVAPKTGYGPWPIDGGRVMKDGNRMLGDGKTWNGLIGGSLPVQDCCACYSCDCGHNVR